MNDFTKGDSGVHRLDWVTKKLRDPEVRRHYLIEVRRLADEGDEWAIREIARMDADS